MYRNTECRNRIIQIINKVCDRIIDFDNNSSAPLTGDDIGITDYQMVYIVLELINEFKINFTAEDFNDYKFSTLDSVTEIVSTKLNAH